MRISDRRLVQVLSLSVALALASGCAPQGEELYARAASSLAKGDARAAAIDLRNLVKDEPENAKARATLGRALIEMGDTIAGEIEVDKARALGASPEVLLLPACELQIAKGEFDAVFRDCDPASAPAEAKSALQVVIGNAQLGAGRPAEAKGTFQSILAREPANLEATLGLAGAVQLIEGSPAAAASLRNANPAVKEFVRYWLSLGAVLSASGDDAGAEASYRTALEKLEQYPDVRERILALGGLAESQLRQSNLTGANETSSKLIKLAPNHAGALQLRAQIVAASGKLDEARGLLEKLVSDFPDYSEGRLLLGMVNLQQGNMDQAEMHFSGVVASEPGNMRAQRLLADVRSKRGSGSAALHDVESALGPAGNSPAMLAIAGQLSVAGNRDQALKYLAQASESSEKSDLQTQFDIANGFLMAGDVDKALEILQALPTTGVAGRQRDVMVLATLLRKGDEAKLKAEAKAVIARSGDDVNVRNLVGGVYGAGKFYDLARIEFSEALRIDPKNAQASLNLAKVDMAQGQPEAAEKNFRRALELDPKNLNATLGIAVAANARKDAATTEKYLRQATTDHPDSVQAHMAAAQFYLGNKQLDEAKALLDSAVKANPKNAAFLNARGVVYVASRDFAGGVASIEEASSLEPANIEYSMNLARAKVVSGDHKGALATVDSVLKVNPTYLPALVMASLTSLEAGDLERATGYIERVSKAAPNLPATYELEGDLAFAQKRYPEAAAAYGKADPTAKNRKVTLARVGALQKANSPQAEVLLGQWIAAHPEDVAAISGMAESKRAKGDLAGAISTYEAALQKAPDSGLLNNNLAMIYQEKGDARALATAEKAYKAFPNEPAIVDTYGWILLGAGKTDEAVKMLEQAASGMPGNAEIQYHYAAALAKAGRKSEALTLLKKAVGGQLPPAARSDALKLMAELSR